MALSWSRLLLWCGLAVILLSMGTAVVDSQADRYSFRAQPDGEVRHTNATQPVETYDFGALSPGAQYAVGHAIDDGSYTLLTATDPPPDFAYLTDYNPPDRGDYHIRYQGQVYHLTAASEWGLFRSVRSLLVIFLPGLLVGLLLVGLGSLTRGHDHSLAVEGGGIAAGLVVVGFTVGEWVSLVQPRTLGQQPPLVLVYTVSAGLLGVGIGSVLVRGLLEEG